MLLLQLLLGISSPAHIDLVMRDLAPPWPSPAKTGGGGIGDGINANSSSSSSPMRFTALHVTMIFIAILLCVIICAIPWDNIKCNGSSSSSRSGGGGHDNQNPLDENAAAPHDEEQQQQQQHPQQQQASGLSKAMIKSFQLVRYGSSSLREKAESENAGGGGGGGGCWAECMICLSDFRNGQMVRILPHCTHGFHKKCIEQWLHSHTSCPICRNVLLVLDSPGKPSTTNTAVSHQHPNHAAPPEALVRQQQQLQQPQEQVVVDLDRVEEEEDDADADAVEHHDHSVYRTYIGISD